MFNSQSSLNVEGKRREKPSAPKCKGTEDKTTEREVSCKDLTPLVSGLRGWFWPRESVLTARSKAIVAESSVPTVHLSHRPIALTRE